jgi:hypothetical protein
MITNEKIELIKDAINRADNLQSNMDAVSWSVPALSSLRIRHLMNNLGAISTRYFECGVHKGGLFCSTVRNNPNIVIACANDSFESDKDSDDKALPQFESNAVKCKSNETIFELRIGDTFSLDPLAGPNGIDLYLFDADHSYESQRKAMTHFLPAMADEFIVCVDDYDWDDVSRGTQDGLADANVEVLYEHCFIGNNHDNEGYWNGYYIALLKKK